MNEPEVCDDIRAGVIAHGIRLGKRITPGMAIDFLVQLKSGEADDIESLDPDKCEPLSEPVRVAFTVEQRDIDNAVKLINSQRAIYCEPKRTTVKLANEV